MSENLKKHFKAIFQDKFNLLLISVFILGNLVHLGIFFSWFMLAVSSYTVVANNYIQTIGSFIVNNKQKFWSNWFFVSVNFTIATLISWFIFNGSLDYSFLKNVEYQKDLNIIIIFIPLLLNIFTKYGIPVSATFLIIPLFGSNSTVHIMLTKTVTSYFLAFMVAFFVWRTIYKYFKNFIKYEKDDLNFFWNFMEYITTALVWIAWNILNICVFVVFVDRDFSIYELLAVNIIVIFVIYIIMVNSGGQIEKIIRDKKDNANKKTTAIFNLLFAIILLSLEFFSNVPLTTTWVFLGLLAGRELALSYVEKGIFADKKSKISLVKIIKDLNKAIIGIVFSLIFVKFILIFC